MKSVSPESTVMALLLHVVLHRQITHEACAKFTCMNSAQIWWSSQAFSRRLCTNDEGRPHFC